MVVVGCTKPPRCPKGQYADPNIVKATALARLTHNDLGILWRTFKRWDVEHKGTININDLFEGMLGEPRNMFTDALFELLDVTSMERAEFGQFVYAMMTYALFETVEIRQFCFFMFDKDKNGFIAKDEFILFVEMIHKGDSAMANIVSTVESLDVDGDGKFTWEDFCKMAEVYPQVLFPCFRLQISICRNVMGVKWWKAKKDFLILERLAEEEKDERIKRKQLAMLEKQRQAAIRRDMGFVDYYFRPDSRYQYDSKYPPTTADQLVQMDTESIEERLNKLTLGGNIETFGDDKAEKGDLQVEELDAFQEDEIVDAYRQIDDNFLEVGNALREGRRIKVDNKGKIKKKKKLNKTAHARYKEKIIGVAHGKVSPGD